MGAGQVLFLCAPWPGSREQAWSGVLFTTGPAMSSIDRLHLIEVTPSLDGAGRDRIQLMGHKFRVVHGTPLGRACVATAPIVENEILCKMAGAVLTLREVIERYGVHESNSLQIGPDAFIDLIEPYICFNHSCDPNAGLRNDGVLFALRSIEPGEEITYDYSTTVDDFLWQMPCACGSTHCRRVIGDFQTIPHERKEYYRERNALLRHLRETYY
jgi:hypothetical protein